MGSRAQVRIAEVPDLYGYMSNYASLCEGILVPLAGIEPALLFKSGIESPTVSRAGSIPD